MCLKTDASDSNGAESLPGKLRRRDTLYCIKKVKSKITWPWESVCPCGIAVNHLHTELEENLTNSTKVHQHFPQLT